MEGGEEMVVVSGDCFMLATGVAVYSDSESPEGWVWVGVDGWD
jgi:hypothetical protein